MSRQALDQLVVVLCEPQDPINIGNTIRAMKNMGLTRLRLVNPGNPDEARIRISAPKAEDIISSMEIFDTLEEALADTVFAAALTARGRRAKRHIMRPREAAPVLLEKTADGPVALLFGREDSGLPNAALDRAQMLVTIPTREDYSSLNLGQAVLLMTHECFLATKDLPELPGPQRSYPVANAAQLEGMYGQVEETLWGIEFFKSGVSEGILRSLRHIFDRATLDEREVRTLRGIFAEVLHYTRRVEKNASKS